MKYVDIHSFDLIGYQKLFSFQDWRIAMLNYIDELEVDNINYVEAHLSTDEAFVLLEGECTLYFAEVEQGRITHFQYVNMEPKKVYRIPQGVYHTHTLNHEAKVLIIEEESTSYENSPRIYLSEQDKALLKKAFMESKHV
jgi:cupin superfamily acireductone dioxygenase involved in methionine salvage